jgi:hypothetical protein
LTGSWWDGRTAAGKAVRAERAEAFSRRDASRVTAIYDGHRHRWYYHVIPGTIKFSDAAKTVTFHYSWRKQGDSSAEIRRCTMPLEVIGGYEERPVAEAPAA